MCGPASYKLVELQKWGYEYAGLVDGDFYLSLKTGEVRDKETNDLRPDARVSGETLMGKYWSVFTPKRAKAPAARLSAVPKELFAVIYADGTVGNTFRDEEAAEEFAEDESSFFGDQDQATVARFVRA